MQVLKKMRRRERYDSFENKYVELQTDTFKYVFKLK